MEDLTAPAASSGTTTSVSVEGVEDAPDHVVTLVWRVAQEAIRNAVRHAHASNLTVEVRGDERQVRLMVRDDGVGFDPSAPARGELLRTARPAEPGRGRRRTSAGGVGARGRDDGTDGGGAAMTGTDAKIRVVIVDDHAMLRAGLEQLLGGEPDLEVVGKAAVRRRGGRARARGCGPTSS